MIIWWLFSTPFVKLDWDALTLITVANAIVGNFFTVDAKTYTFDIIPSASGNVTVDVLAAKATDNVGNNNSAATQLTRTVNITLPLNNQPPIVNNPMRAQTPANVFSSNTAFVFAADTFIDPNPGDTVTYTVTALDNNSVAQGQDFIWTWAGNGSPYQRKTQNASVTTIPTIFGGPNASLNFDPHYPHSQSSTRN